MAKIENIQQITEEIFILQSPRINSGKKNNVFEFLKIVVNGDSIKDHLVINASLTKNKSGALVYILTDARLISLSVEESGEVESSSYKLDTMVGVSRKLDEDRIEVEVTFQGNNAVGLRYPISSNIITKFFQKIDQEQSEENSDDA